MEKVVETVENRVTLRYQPVEKGRFATPADTLRKRTFSKDGTCGVRSKGRIFGAELSTGVERVSKTGRFRGLHKVVDRVVKRQVQRLPFFLLTLDLLGPIGCLLRLK